MRFNLLKEIAFQTDPSDSQGRPIIPDTMDPDRTGISARIDGANPRYDSWGRGWVVLFERARAPSMIPNIEAMPFLGYHPPRLRLDRRRDTLAVSNEYKKAKVNGWTTDPSL